jgi:Cd2+/Zn2+-exporting ATPase
VRPGGRVPLDGQVHEGQSAVNQAPVTGESVPVEKSRGDEVFAGSVNGQGSFTFEVTRTQNDSTIARIARAVQEAQGQRAPVQRFVDSFARIYTPLVVLAAFLFAIVPPLFFEGDWATYFYRALVLLVIACPCALVISTPVTVVSGLTLAARQGLIIKGGLYLEQGRNLRALAFDKTGTLTIGRPQITQIIALTQDEKPVLQIAASLNSLSEHPLAVAFWEKWQAQGEKVLSVENFAALPGRGVRGEIENQSFWLGNFRLAQENGAEVPPIAEELENAGQTVVFLGRKQETLALFALADAPRPEAAQVIAQLKAQGITPILLSGDNSRVVQAVSKQLGITRQHGELLPEEKLNAIAELESEFGAIGMMGDGINDAPALARATIGFCPGAGGTAVALETADVALLQDDLRLLPLFFKISRATLRVLWQNIALALGIKALFFALALAGYATLWMAVFADVGASLLVILNGLRLLRLKA